MPKTIQEVLADANLTEAQVEEIAGILQEAKVELRTAHAEEVRLLSEAKDAALADLVRSNLEKDAQLQEAASAPPSQEVVSQIEERARREANQAAATMLTEALAPFRNHLRALKNYSAMSTLVEKVQDAFGTSFAEALDEAAGVPAVTTPAADLNESATKVAQLEEALFKAQSEAAFKEATSDLAETTKLKVSTIVDAAKTTTLEEFTLVLGAACAAVAAPPAAAAATDLNESVTQPPANGVQPPAQMASYVAALGSPKAAK